MADALYKRRLGYCFDWDQSYRHRLGCVVAQ
jgi:hypothetical protein